ncbi:uncharacterized protein JCM15063_006582 [Sporobolomyces koalae]|uniref:uncharacterized protein n=1 Tax=Sporobolomyces koalae TaxID=500713 RepID=UPI0031815BB0
MTRTLSALIVGGLVALATAYTPAYPNDATSDKNSTLLSGWRTDQGQGTLNQGVTLLANGTSTSPNSSYHGVIVYFNETLAENQTSTAVPFIAFISCDSNPSTQSTLALPFTANGTIATNSTLESNSTSGALNSTNVNSSSNSTLAGNNSTETRGTNSTLNGVNSTYLPNVFNLAAEMGASSVLLYSEQANSCQLNLTADATFNNSLPIFTSSSLDTTKAILTSQFGNVEARYRIFNSTLISDAAENLTQIIATGGKTDLPTWFLVGRLTAAYNRSDDGSGVVATIGRAPSSTRAAEGSAPTNQPSTPSSDADRATGRYAIIASLIAAGLAVLAA